MDILFENDDFVFSYTVALSPNVMGMGGVSGSETAMSAELLEDGKAYVVTYNGVEYSCVCNSETGALALGNLEHMNGSGNGEPFMVADINGTVSVFDLNNAESCDITIATTTETIHPIDQKFLNVLRVKFDTADGQNFTGADKTIDEIIEAFKNGKTIVGYYEMDMDGRYVGGELLLCGVNKTDSMKACTFNTFVIAGTSMVAQLLTYKEFDGETTITLTTHTSAN